MACGLFAMEEWPVVSTSICPRVLVAPTRGRGIIDVHVATAHFQENYEKELLVAFPRTQRSTRGLVRTQIHESGLEHREMEDSKNIKSFS